MGIETILIVVGLAVVVAIGVGVSRLKRKAASTQSPKSSRPSTVRPKA